MDLARLSLAPRCTATRPVPSVSGGPRERLARPIAALAAFLLLAPLGAAGDGSPELVRCHFGVEDGLPVRHVTALGQVPDGLPEGEAGLGGPGSAPFGLPVERRPFFWQTPWFGVVCVGSLGVALVSVYRLRLRTLRSRVRYLERTVEERTLRLHENETQIAHQAEDLRRANELKSCFLAHVSHELRTARPARIDLGALVRRWTSAFESVAAARGIGLRCRTGDVPRAWVADPARLKTVVYNLVANALDCTPAGGTVAIELRDGAAGEAVLVVRDTGAGADVGCAARSELELLHAEEVDVPDREREFLDRLRAAMEAGVGEPRFNVDELAAELFMSRRQLLRKVKALTGEAPGDLLRRLRLERAAALLRCGASVKEASRAVGFRSASHFSQAFRVAHGATPAAYRAESASRRPWPD